MTFTESAYNHIKDTIGYLEAEKGGILLGDRDDFVVKKYVFDRNGRTSGGAYDPDISYLNKVVKYEWENNDLAFLGFIHSHPNGVSRLSGEYGAATGDMAYIKTIFEAMPALEKFLAPIIFSEANGDFEIFPYVSFRENPEDYQLAELEVVAENQIEKTVKEVIHTDFVPDYSRLEGAIDAQIMQDAHIVCIGIGGANQICESLVRNGLGHLTVVDFDKVDKSNLATQGFYISDIGKSKVKALEGHLRNINPSIDYRGFESDFLKMDAEELKSTMEKADLLLMMTDNFFAQARGNKVALKYNVPSIFAMMYERARCSEISFTIPGVTPGCHRCAVSSRYKAYEEGFKNDVTSTGSTVFHTQNLNSKIGLLALAILHNDTQDLEFSNWFGSAWDRNFLQVRTHPQYSMDKDRLFRRTFEGMKGIFNFDTIWQKIEPESFPQYEQPCPDCGGIGDLNISSKFISLLQNPVFRKSDWLKDEEI